MKRKYVSVYAWTGWILAALIVIGGTGGCKPEKTEATITRLPETVTVEVRPIIRERANRVIAVSGTMEADKTSPLGFLVPGKVDRIYVDEGDHVTSGKLLATLESDDYQSNLSIAEAALVRAKDAYDRYEPLYHEGAFAEKNFIELKTGLTQAEAARDIAQKALDDTRLIAPIPGIIGTKGIEIGQMVSPQTPAFTIVKTDVIYARVSVPESEISQVAMGQGADVSLPALGGRWFAGTVSMIGAVADQRTRTYPVKIEIANPEFLLRPGMIVRVRIQSDVFEEVLTIPGRAIVRDADNLTYVFVADLQKKLALRKRVTPGAAFRSGIAITDGLTLSDIVIVSGQHKLTDGTPITISQSDTPEEVR